MFYWLRTQKETFSYQFEKIRIANQVIYISCQLILRDLCWFYAIYVLIQNDRKVYAFIKEYDLVTKLCFKTGIL